MPHEETIKSGQRKSRTILSVPLSLEQREDLVLRAGRMPLSTYVRGVLFPMNDNLPATSKRPSRTVKDDVALARIIAQFGAWDAAANLRESLRLARLGALPLTPETEAAVERACADVAEIKALVMMALGVKER